MAEQIGRILWGSNNIYSVADQANPEAVFECRVKGKQLAVGDEYNVLVPGDLVTFEASEQGGLILDRRPRRNALVRWNKKSSNPQAFAANVDQAFCVCSPESPPFRPRFIDRCLVAADHAEVAMVILVNKIDQSFEPADRERLENFRSLGYEVWETSLVDGRGIEALRTRLQGQVNLFMGQSGVGKTSLINALVPAAKAKIGEVSAKFNRGRHTTVLAKTYDLGGGGAIIDTPGVREFEPASIDPQALPFLYREIQPLAANCELYNCSHTEEPGCAVRLAAENGEFLADRYESYLRLLEAVRLQFETRQ